MIDRVKQFIDECYAEAHESQRRVIIELDQFLNIAVVTARIGPRTRIRRYLDGYEIFAHWLEIDDRREWVARMKVEGFTGKRIATFLSVSPSTIYNDIRVLREGTKLLNPRSRGALTSHRNLRRPEPPAIGDPAHDVHRTTASEVFDAPLGSMNDEQRRAAKTINFGLL